MKTLVTGGAGFIGAWIVDTLLRDGHDKSVVVLDDLSGGFIENLDMRTTPPRVQFYQGSVTDELLVDKLFDKHGFDYVYHCAAYAAEGLSHHIRRFNYTNNLIGSVNLINASIRHKVKCFIFMSSIAVYGNPVVLPVDESSIPYPIDPYGISKYAVELDLKAARKMFGLNHIIFRPHNVYGPYQNIGDPYRNVVGIFMNQCMQKKPLTIFGDGQQTRAFTYIEDIAPYMARCIDYPKAYNQIFDVGSPVPTSVSDLANEILKVMSSASAISYLPERHEVKYIYSDHRKFMHTFGTIPFTPLSIGLRRTADWVKQYKIRQSKPFENIEVEENMPPSWKELVC